MAKIPPIEIDPETGMPIPQEQPETMYLNEEFVPEFDIRVQIGVDKPIRVSEF